MSKTERNHKPKWKALKDISFKTIEDGQIDTIHTGKGNILDVCCDCDLSHSVRYTILDMHTLTRQAWRKDNITNALRKKNKRVNKCILIE